MTAPQVPAAETWTLDDGSVVESYRPSNGTEGEIFMATHCARCSCEPSLEQRDEHDGCEIITLTMALDTSDAEYPKEWVRRISDGATTCTAFHARPIDWDGVPDDPRKLQAQQARYDQLPRDPTTGRPVT